MSTHAVRVPANLDGRGLTGVNHNLFSKNRQGHSFCLINFSQSNESLENSHTFQHEEATAKRSSHTRQGPHGRQRGCYRSDATPVGKPSPDIALDFELCCNDKSKSMPGMILRAIATCLTSHCPLLTNCSTLPPFFNTPDYWTEGLKPIGGQ